MTDNMPHPPLEVIDEIEKPKGDPLSISDFNERIAALSDPEEKLNEAIFFMRSCLMASKNPYFKGFWEGSKVALALFKENLSPGTRSLLWGQYKDLCQEFRKIKQVLDEQSEFAAEQIGLAIDALQKEITDIDQLVEKQPEISFIQSHALQENFKIYNTLQTELNLLNAYASRINSLRKELMKTEMRIRTKNKFFKDLSSLGDKIFPRRKELIKSISQTFQDDVQHFISSYFNEGEVNAPLYFMREEIKALQGIAKFLTLNTTTFNETRQKLSECWDAVRLIEKEKKKEFQEKKSIYKQNEEIILAKIDELKNEFNAANIQEKIALLFDLMHSYELGKDERKALKNNILEIAEPFIQQQKQQLLEREQKEKEAIALKLEQIKQFKMRVQNLRDSLDTLDVEQATKEKEDLLVTLQNLSCTKPEKQQLEKSLKPLKDLLNEKRENAALNLSADEKHSLENLKEILKQRQERKKEIKDRLEDLRKQSSVSTLNFEKALSMKELIQEEKIRLEKVEAGINDIQKQIRTLV